MDNKPGLYFAKKFQFLLTSEHWTIAIGRDLNNVKNKLERVNSIWDEGSSIPMKSNLTIGAILFSQIWNTITHATHKTIQLYEFVRAEVLPARTKRGVFSSIGFGLLSQMLFGTMDSDDAEYYNKKIRTIDSNQYHIYQLEKDQLIFIKHVLTAVKSFHARFQEQSRCIPKEVTIIVRI